MSWVWSGWVDLISHDFCWLGCSLFSRWQMTLWQQLSCVQWTFTPYLSLYFGSCAYASRRLVARWRYWNCPKVFRCRSWITPWISCHLMAPCQFDHSSDPLGICSQTNLLAKEAHWAWLGWHSDSILLSVRRKNLRPRWNFGPPWSSPVDWYPSSGYPKDVRSLMD